MNPFELEAQRQKVIELLSECTSCRQKLVVYKHFFKSILASPGNEISNTYFLEFIEDYFKCLKEYSPLYINPEFTSELLSQLSELKDRFMESSFIGELELIYSEIQRRFRRYTELLNGYIEVFQPNQKVSFPVLEKQLVNVTSFGMLEFLTIKISRGSISNKFIIIPSDKTIESRLFEQVVNSWQVALDFTKRQTRRINTFHEVIIYFDNRSGEYEGNSLGIALTIGFVEALLKFYNTPYLVNIKENISSTGGMDVNGKILSISESIMKKKIEIVFYSNTSLFIVPSADLIKAEKALNDIKQNYPKRELRLIGISDLDDLLNRRNLITIKKQNPLIRTSRLALDNWVISIALLLILFFAGYTILFNQVDNPVFLDTTTTAVYVRNSHGTVLFKKTVRYPKEYIDHSSLNYYQKVVDINDDGINEVLFCQEPPESINDRSKFGRVVCLDKNGNEIWEYLFRDTISSPREVLEPLYGIILIDTINYHNHKRLYAIATNFHSFSSAIFSLDLKTGKRLPGTIWHSGFITQAIITDLDNDNKKDILATACNNPYNKISFFGINIKEWNSALPTTPEYFYYNKQLENVIFYVLLPRTDYLDYQKFRLPGVYGNLQKFEIENSYNFTTQEGPTGEDGLIYRLDYNLKDFRVTVGNNYRVRRDSLVAKGILSPPLTDTKEYFELIESQILFWNGARFVKKDELK